MGVHQDTKILTYEKGYISVSDIYTQYNNQTPYRIWNGVSWSNNYSIQEKTNQEVFTITTTNQLKVSISSNQKFLIGGQVPSSKNYSEINIGDELAEYGFPNNMQHLTDPDSVPSPLSEGLFMISGGKLYKNHNYVQIPYTIKTKLPEIQTAVYIDIYKDRQTIIILDSPNVTKGINWVPYGYSTKTKLEWLEGIFYMAGNTQISSTLQYQIISIVGTQSQLPVLRSMQLAMHELGVNSHIQEYIYSQSTPEQCTDGNLLDPICAFEFLKDFNNIQLNEGDIYYLLYTNIASTEHLLEAGFKQNLVIFTRNKLNLNVSQWRPMYIYDKETEINATTYNINETRSGNFLANGILLQGYIENI